MIKNIKKLLQSNKKREQAQKHSDSIRELMKFAGYTIIRENLVYYKKGEQIVVDTAYTHSAINKSVIYLPFKIEPKALTRYSLHNAVTLKFFRPLISTVEIHCKKCHDYVVAEITSTTEGKDKIHLQIICARCKTYWGALTIEEQGVK